MDLVKAAMKGMYHEAEVAGLALTVVLAVLIIATLLFIKFKKPEWLKTAFSVCTGIVVGYSITIVTIMMSLYFYRYKGKGIFANNVEYSIVGFLSKGQLAQLYIYPIVIVAIVLALAFIIGKKRKEVDKTRAIVYGAICIAMSFALSYIKLYELPQGGSITFASLVPVMIYSYMFGVRKGILIGFIYGILQFFQSPWFYHPIQFLLDYPIAFMTVGLTGLVREANIIKKEIKFKQYVEFMLGAFVVLLLRYFSHVVSGIFVFGSAEPSNYSNVAWSFLYNLFAFADMAIVLVAAFALFASRSFFSVMKSVGIQDKNVKISVTPEEETATETVVLEDDEK